MSHQAPAEAYAARIVLVKQQGAMRTGTNLVKFALEENFTNVRVLVNIGRWKHATADTPFTWHGENWEMPGRVVDVATRITPVELRTVRAAVDPIVGGYAPASCRTPYADLPAGTACTSARSPRA